MCKQDTLETAVPAVPSAIVLEDKNAQCYVCGSDNSNGLQVPFVPDGENGSYATYIARAEHVGWPGVLHGGVMYALMDEAIGWSLYYSGLRGVTAKTETRFRQPVKVGTPLTITGRIERVARRMVYVSAEVKRSDASAEVVAELSGTMFLLNG